MCGRLSIHAGAFARHASSVKTSMHRIRLLSFLRSFFAEKARAHRELISTNSSLQLNSKMKNELLIQYQKILNRCRVGKNVYIIKSCLMLSILPRYSYFDSSDLCIHLKAVLRRSKKSSLQNCGYSCGIDIPHADCQPRLVGVAKGLLPLKNCHGICIVTHCNCIENAGFFVFLCCCLGHFC